MKQYFFMPVLFGLLLSAFVWAGDSPEKVIHAGKNRCLVFSNKLILINDIGADSGETEQEVYVALRQTDIPLEVQCRDIQKGTRIYKEGARWESVIGDVVFLVDTMSAPGTERYYLFDKSGNFKRTIETNDGEVSVENGEIVFFEWAKELAPDACPKKWRGGSGCVIKEKTSLNLSTFQTKKLGKQKYFRFNKCH